MKKLAFFIVFLVVSSSLFAKDKPESAVLLDGIAAIVNEDVIPLSDVEMQVARVLGNLRRQGKQTPSLDILRQQVLEHLITEELKLQEARKRGIKIDDVMLNRQLENIAQTRNLTLSQLREVIIKDGTDYVEFREQMRRDMAVQQAVVRIVRSRVRISEQEITDHLNSVANRQNRDAEYKLSHIMIQIPEVAKPEVIQKAKAKADDIYKQLLAGGDFAQLAISYSDGQRALEGGELDWRKKHELPSDFALQLLMLGEDDFSKPFRTPSGFHILKLDDSRGIQRHVIDQVKARHILIKPNQLLDNEQVRQKLLSLRQRIKAGEDFSILAKEFSDDSGSAALGGELDWQSPSVYDPAFKRIVTELPLNTLSEPFRSVYGWHIVEVQGRRQHDNTLTYNRDQAHRALLSRKAQEEEQLWLRQIRNQAYIVKKLDRDVSL